MFARIVFILTVVMTTSLVGAEKPPNIIFILADDLGYAELGCYGQTRIKTPNIDGLAKDGMRFTQYYSGHPVCAPSRCALLTGMHSGHGFVRDNKEIGEWKSFQGQWPLPAETRTLAHVLKDRGYATACVGKWGLGAVGSTGEPAKMGFDLFYGYNCQRQAHNYYPTYLMKNADKVPLDGNDGESPTGKVYAPDLMIEEALGFIRQNKEKPFFLYFATPIPHAALQVPEDSLAEYAGKLDDVPYDGKKGYQPHATPHAAYAAMITRMDRDVGRLLKLLSELDLEKNTIVFFASDNGPTFNGGTDSPYFKSAGIFRGLKQQVYEGGIRVPFIARWPGKIAAGQTSEQPTAAWDVLPTLCEITGASAPANIDGLSLAPTLFGQPGQKQHEYFYWESGSLEGGEQAVRMGDWKGVRLGLRKNADAAIQVYNLKDDPSEANDLAAKNPEMAAKLLAQMKAAHTPSKDFPLYAAEKK
jgi:arylsulfatase A